MVEFKPVENMPELNALFEESSDKPVVVFKHSNTCSISRRAYQTMKQVSSPVSILVIQQSRDLSREIADRTGINHESPQVIVLRNGTAVWSASHWNFTAADVENAVLTNR